MKLKMTYMILHYNSWMFVPAQALILAGICILWPGYIPYRTNLRGLVAAAAAVSLMQIGNFDSSTAS